MAGPVQGEVREKRGRFGRDTLHDEGKGWDRFGDCVGSSMRSLFSFLPLFF